MFEQTRRASISPRLKSPECRFLFHDAGGDMARFEVHMASSRYKTVIPSSDS